MLSNNFSTGKNKYVSPKIFYVVLNENDVVRTSNGVNATAFDVGIQWDAENWISGTGGN